MSSLCIVSDADRGQRSSLRASTLPLTDCDLALLAVLLAACFFFTACGFLGLIINAAERTLLDKVTRQLKFEFGLYHVGDIPSTSLSLAVDKLPKKVTLES